MRIHQMLPNYWYGDAIGNTVTEFQRLLRLWGHESKVFANVVHEKLTALPYHEYVNEPEDSLFIYHYSTGSVVNDFALDRADKVILMYHNITPARFFDGYDPTAAARCREGRELLRKFAGKVRLAMAVSSYNEAELKSLGFGNTAIVPCIIDFDRMKPSGKKAFDDGKTNILFVGRVSPNKRHEDLIASFRYYKEFIDPDSRLILVGGFDRGGKYYNGLQNLINVWGLGDVVFTGSVSDEELGGYFASATAFLCLSRHEGFCIPLIEAMRLGVPVIALAQTAIKDTMDGAGLMFDDYNPAQIAEGIRLVKEDAGFRAKIIQRQHDRVRVFDKDVLTDIFKKAIEKATGG